MQQIDHAAVRHFLRRGLLILGALMLPLSASGEETQPAETNPLYIAPAERDFSENPSLLERILSGPHGYYRFINIPFSQEVCRRFSDEIPGMPSLNLHGDAHIEQYAITDLGRGLTDFDDASTGPGMIDILRFGVSLQLAARENGWNNKRGELLEVFLRGYRSALENPDTTAPEPALVQQIRAGFTVDREAYFRWVDEIMAPAPPEVRDSLIQAMQPYIETKLAEKPSLTEAYFQIVDFGYLHMGIGSALDLKFLVRIRGAGDAAADDVVLEIKEVRDLSGIDCIDSGREQDPFRILVGQTRIAYAPFKHLGYFRFRERNFWVHSWVDNYKEVKIETSFSAREDLQEVAYDVGVQLGKGHIKHIAYPLDLQLRREQLRLIDSARDQIAAACDELARLTVDAWEMFCREAKRKGE